MKAWALQLHVHTLPEPGRMASVAQPVVVGHVTLRAVAERYLEASAHRLSPESQRTYRNALKAAEGLIVDGGALLERSVHEVTQGWAQLAHDAVREQRGGATADKLAKLLGASHRHAANRGENYPPCYWGRIERYGSPQLEIHFSAGWLAQALAVLERAGDELGVVHPRTGKHVRLPERIVDYYTICMSTGARPWCEVRQLRWRDIDEAKGVIVFAFSKGQNGKPKIRRIPLAVLCQRARDALERQRSHAVGQHVWPGRDGRQPVGETTIARWWVPFREYAAQHMPMDDAQGEPLDLYRASRHAFASHLGDLGYPPHIIAEFLGHTDHRSQARYKHLSGRHLLAPAKEIAASLDRSTNMQAALALDTAPGLVPERLAKAIDWIERQTKLDQLLQRPTIEILKPDGEPYTARSWTGWRAYGRGLDYAAGGRKPDDVAVHQMAMAIGISVGWLYGEGPDDLPEVRA